MRKTSWTLAVVGCAAFVAGAHADDATPTAPSADVVFAAGDKLHGYLRGGETDALQVHLAKGDVYSFSVAAKGGLLLHLTMLDPRGHEINEAAKVKHSADGKHVAVGPFRAPATGTYVLELMGDGTYFSRGDFVATSKVRLGRTSYALPSDGSPMDVQVPAGPTLKLRAKQGLSTLSMGLPGQSANSFASSDALVVSLRANGLASSSTGTYHFAIQDAQNAVLSVSRVNWKPLNVGAPTFDELPADKIPADFRFPTTSNGTPNTGSTTPTPVLQTVAAPVPVGLTQAGGGRLTTSMFVSADIDSAGVLASHIHMPDGTVGFTGGTDAVFTPPPVISTPVTPPVSSGGGSDPVTPPVTPIIVTPPAPPPVVPPIIIAGPSDPVDLAGFVVPVAPPAASRTNVSANGPTQSGIPTHTNTYAYPGYQSCAQMIGKPLMFGNYGFRNAPWVLQARSYPSSIGSSLVPQQNSVSEDASAATHGDDSDPFQMRVFTLTARIGNATSSIGSITTTTRYYVDGHQVASLLASGGDTTVVWDIAGAGTIGGTPWSMSGHWTSLMHPTDVKSLYYYYSGMPTGAALPSCTISGGETYLSGSVTEGLTLSYHMNPYSAPQAYDPSGDVKNTLNASDLGLTQSVDHTYFAPDRVQSYDRWFPVETVIITIDPTTPANGVEDDTWTTFTLC